VLYAWFPLAALLFFMLLIGRFYQKFSGQPTHFRWFGVPVLLFGGAAVRYASINRVAYDPLADAALALGGLILLYLCLSLYWRMTRHSER
jgi:hypothetical protein